MVKDQQESGKGECEGLDGACGGPRWEEGAGCSHGPT